VSGPVSLGIVNYNGRTYLPDTLEAVRRVAPGADVMLVDNGSADGSVALARARLPRLRIFELGENRGPSAARNVAVREAAHDRVLLLDNDVEPQPGCIEALAEALDAHPRAVAAMPAVLYARAPDTLQYAGAEAHFMGVSAPRAADTAAALLEPPVRVVGTVITCCMLVDRARLGRGPWFDERLFFHFEDHEFGLRLSLAGFEVIVVPAARCLHGAGTPGLSLRETGRFTPTRIRYTIRNRWLTMLMLYQKRTLLRFAPALLAFEIVQLFGAAAKGWIGHWVWALASAASLIPYALRRRGSFRRIRRRADLEVLVGGPFPYNPAMQRTLLERTARRFLDRIIALNWQLAAGRRRT
jgi:GT2 family glycosyltransferase